MSAAPTIFREFSESQGSPALLSSQFSPDSAHLLEQFLQIFVDKTLHSWSDEEG
jgi:hypothetical protein